MAGDGELVVELGAPNGSLAASLERLGYTSAPRPLKVQVDLESAPAPDLGPDDVPVEQGGQQVQPPAPAAEPAGWIEVELGEGQTLMDLAMEHLGTSRRYLEIMEWNGLSDRDARRLKVGQKIRLLKSGAGN